MKQPRSSDRSIEEVHIVPTFHYDVAYVRPEHAYKRQGIQIIDEALDLLLDHPSYCFLIEQVILLEAYWEHRRERRGALKALAAASRLAVAPGMYCMPDMNLPDGELLYRQIKVGKDWLREHLEMDPEVCWIADCWGHHAQLPQILRQAGYRYYVFMRCMRPDVMRSNFVWEGLDGSRIRTHWLAGTYEGLRFPVHDGDGDYTPEDVRQCARDARNYLSQYGDSPVMLACNGGDFLRPQPTAPGIVPHLNADASLPRMRFSTPMQALDRMHWDAAPVVQGEFNSAFQGTFTSNIRIKQWSRLLGQRLRSLEMLSVLRRRPMRDFEKILRLFLKQQFHDIICGTICDEALDQSLKDFRRISNWTDRAFRALDDEEGASYWFNALPFPRRECIRKGDRRVIVDVPALGYAAAQGGEVIRPNRNGASLPFRFEAETYRATLHSDGFISSLEHKASGRNVVDENGPPFGTLAMQLDRGDLWLNFEAPLSAGNPCSRLTRNVPDPVDRRSPESMVADQTFYPEIAESRIVFQSEALLEICQEGVLAFSNLRIPYRTTVRLLRTSPRIEYRTRLHPRERHYRIRVMFPTPFSQGRIRHEIPFGIQERGPGEHPAQTWHDLSGPECGLAVLNRGIPASNADNGIMMLTLFRAVNMEHKASSNHSFAEGTAHEFSYAVMPHGLEETVGILRQAHAFSSPLERISLKSCIPDGWKVNNDNVSLSALRWRDDRIFVRLYETIGARAKGLFCVPDWITHYMPADGLERPAGPARVCTGTIPYTLDPFAIRAFLLEPRENRTGNPTKGPP